MYTTSRGITLGSLALLLAVAAGSASAESSIKLYSGPLLGSSFACLALNTTDADLVVTLRLHREDGSINTSLSLPIEPGKVRLVQDNITFEGLRYCTAEYVGKKNAVRGAFCVLDIFSSPDECFASVPLGG
jgi:hypothetical protein